MNRSDKIRFLQMLATPGNNLPQPRQGGCWIEVLEDTFENDTGKRMTLKELQNMPGQISPMPLVVVFDSADEPAEFFTTSSGSLPFVRSINVQGKNYPSTTLYTLSGLTASDALKLIHKPK